MMKHILHSALYQQDLAQGLCSLDCLNRLNGKTVLVTGASGLICSCLIDLLLTYNQLQAGSIAVVAAGRNTEALRERFAPFGDPHIHYVAYDANVPISFDCNVDYVIHGASNAFPKAISAQPMETMWANIYGLHNLIYYAQSHDTKRILLVSSSEVYGNKQTDEPFCETEHGYVNINDPRSSYPVSKMAAETLCASASAEYGIDCVIARPGHIYGPTASRKDNRVSSMFAYAAAEGKPIVMKSAGEQLRSYCYCVDCASAMLAVLLKGENNVAYNIANSSSVITIRQMSELLTEAGDCTLSFDLPSEAEKKSFNPMRNSSLNTERLTALGWAGSFSARDGLSHTVSILRELLD